MCHVVPVVVSCCVGGVWATDRKSAIPFDDQAKPDLRRFQTDGFRGDSFRGWFQINGFRVEVYRLEISE